jgi:uncharacterized membrane protein HdeD (DUF308 family)
VRDLEVNPDKVREMGRLWWLPVGLGVLSIIVGGIVIAKPDNSLKAIAVITGIFILIDGIAELVLAFSRDTANRGTVAVLGTLNTIIGIVLIRHPVASVQAIALLLGIWLVAAGICRFVLALDTHGDRLGRFIVAALEALFGIVILSSVHIGLTTLAILVGLSFIANGFGMIVFGILMRTMKDQSQPPGLAVAA